MDVPHAGLSLQLPRLLSARGDDKIMLVSHTCASLKSPETLRPLLASLGRFRAARLWASFCAIVTCPKRTLLERPLPG